MSTAAEGHVHGADLSAAWRETVDMVGGAPEQKMFHTVTRIASPLVEDLNIRAQVDSLLAARNLSSVETVANTIFPAQLAATSASSEVLHDRYLRMYDRLKKFDGNHQGTYFGRILSYPHGSSNVDQLSRVIARLRQQVLSARPLSACYEVAVEAPGDADPHVGIFSPPSDRSVRGFPCLSFCSLQLDGSSLHLLAHYRYEYLIEKGYGNFLGLARLQGYVAEQVGIAAGRLTIVTGRIQVDIPMKRVGQYLDGLPL